MSCLTRTRMAGLLAVGAIGFGSAGFTGAATIVQGDVTANLAGSFFVDDAVVGGSDVITTNGNSPRNIGPRNWDIDSSGTIDAGDLQAGILTINGIGFASNASTVNNSATSITFGFIYLGADGVLGGGDDVNLGSETVGRNFIGAGEYYVNFDNPIVGAIDGANNKFIVTIDTNGTGNLVTKSANSLAFETFSGPKLSISGSFVPEPSSLALIGLGAVALMRRRRG